MAKTATISHRDIIEEVNKGVFKPVYLLMGEEGYYIDKLTDFIAQKALTEDQQAFNLTTIYGTPDTNVGEIINMARRYPVNSQYQVIIVKECQNVKKIDDLAIYLQKPVDRTIIILSYKNGKIDKRKKVVGMIASVGTVFESERLKDTMLPFFIDDYLKRKKVAIDENAKMMLADNIGADLSRMASEIDKLCITLKEGERRITADHIEKNIGISKNFNQWELRDAIVKHDVLKANRIINYFCDNPKLNSPIMTVAVLFSFFANLMQAYYSPDKTEQGMVNYLDFKSAYQLRDIKAAMRFYNGRKTMEIIAKLREADARLKGIGKGNMTDAEVMKELIFFILH